MSLQTLQNSEVAGAVWRGQIDADRCFQFACDAVLIVTRGVTAEKPVTQGSKTCASFPRISSVRTNRSGELCVHLAPTHCHSSQPRGEPVVAHDCLTHEDWTPVRFGCVPHATFRGT